MLSRHVFDEDRAEVRYKALLVALALLDADA